MQYAALAYLGTLASSCRSYKVNPASRIYVFISGDHKHIGLTNDQGGRNLPSPPFDVHVWVKLQEIPCSRNAIYRLNIDPTSALLNMEVHGYHVVSPEAEVIPFPPRTERQ